MAAKLVMDRIQSDPVLVSDFSEGKMLGVLVCRPSAIPKSSSDISSEQSIPIISSERQRVERSLCYLAAFSGNVGGQSIIDGFVPPIFDLTSPDGHFKKGEAEISAINKTVSELTSSDILEELKNAFENARSRKETEIEKFKNAISEKKAERARIRSYGISEEEQHRLILESQHEKAELRRLRNTLQSEEDSARMALDEYLSQVNKLKALRAQMSDNLQDWIFKQYIVHNALGESSSIADIFASSGLVPPGGSGECAAPKLLEYAYRNSLEPLAMGEFWFGKSSETAVRVHGHFYPSCTSKCGPLLNYMLKGKRLTEDPYGSDYHLHAVRMPDSCADKGRDKKRPIIIYEDNSILVAEKPSGIPSVPGLDGRVSLLEWLTSTSSTEPFSTMTSVASMDKSNAPSSVMSSERSESRHLLPVHRLDMDTSGIMVFAKTKEAEVHLKKQFEEHSVQKTYMARICGTLNFPSGAIDLPLSPDYDERPRQKVDFKQGKHAHTEYRIISENQDDTTDILLYPHTGRTHQLRVHCAHALGLDLPILGDLLYGAHSVYNMPCNATKRLHLHALSITFRHPKTEEPFTFTSDRLSWM